MSFPNIAITGSASSNFTGGTGSASNVNDGNSDTCIGCYGRTYGPGSLSGNIQIKKNNEWCTVGSLPQYFDYMSSPIVINQKMFCVDAIRYINNGSFSGAYTQIDFNSSYDGNIIEIYCTTSILRANELYYHTALSICEIKFYGIPTPSNRIIYKKSDESIDIIKPRIDFSGMNQSLKIQTSQGTRGFILVDTTDSDASPLRIMTSTGVKSILHG